MTYERYRRRAVNIVWCYTTSVARTMPNWHKLRVVNEYKRRPISATIREATAAQVHQQRSDGLTRREVRRNAMEIIANPRGVALRVDIERELAEMT